MSDILEVAGAVLLAVGLYLTAGTGPALIVMGALAFVLGAALDRPAGGSS